MPSMSLLASVFLALVALWVGRQSSARTARRGAIAGTALVAGALVALAVFTVRPEPSTHATLGARNMSWVVALIGLLATALSPLSSHPPRTLARVLLLLAAALGFLSTAEPLVLAAFWSLSQGVVFWELWSRRETSPAYRVFALYQVPSTLLFAWGAIRLMAGDRESAALLILLATAIREAALPLHSWFPSLVEQAPMGIVVAFVAPQLGVYAHLILVTDALASDLVTHLVAGAAAFTAIVAALLGLAQHDARRALAYLIISQTALVAFGLDTSSPVGVTGGLLLWQVAALATTGFAMTISALQARRGNLSLRGPGGNFAETPRMATALLILGFSGAGLPMSLGFVAEDLLVQGSVGRFPHIGLAMIIATALNGVTVMRLFFALFSGTRTRRGEPDLNRRELVALTLVLALLFVGGLFPHYVVSSIVL